MVCCSRTLVQFNFLSVVVFKYLLFKNLVVQGGCANLCVSTYASILAFHLIIILLKEYAREVYNFLILELRELPFTLSLLPLLVYFSLSLSLLW